MCEFDGVILKAGVTIESLEKIVIDGYHVWCAYVSQLECIKLKILDGLKTPDEIRFTFLKPQNITAKTFFSTPIYPEINKGTLDFGKSVPSSSKSIIDSLPVATTAVDTVNIAEQG